MNLGSNVACYRLFQLISPSLPIGGFTYSQGLEYAVEAGWVSSKSELEDWLTNMAMSSIATLELPILDKFYGATQSPSTADDIALIDYWSEVLYASRETRELRAEEIQRGKALNTLLRQLDMDMTAVDQMQQAPNQLVGLCIAAHHWQISLDDLKQGYLWSWLENMVTAGVKLVPLGQTDGQRTLLAVTEHFPNAIKRATQIEDWMISSFTPSIAMASSLHETQYTRLFRS
ncbi:urease accessory protein UreF [Vibrio breoganii]|uniref:Urease accessory protein UreF n=1 Tax=Vibrio breoganii TaxID=553239 RepID=A0AAP8MVE2_9VIBR|nr:urease accessory UreF family protein [Vibrio breoganii]PMK17776.1 urease accessory protein UreF [Vibrio breoganii]PMM17170.1 urease accessory protein UreF [Vibrio breoganii]PMP09077.1 urease accessory protein UreF [Vibrio breoganii]TKF89949.1 urease accessory protein UreF [Vibrio breoganii]